MNKALHDLNMKESLVGAQKQTLRQTEIRVQEFTQGMVLASPPLDKKGRKQKGAEREFGL